MVSCCCKKVENIGMKKVLVRVDGGNKLGMGHVMRCITLARELKKKNIEVFFVCADEKPKLIIKNNGFEIMVLKKGKQEMNCELPEMIEIINKTDANLCIIDSYFATNDYYMQIQKHIPLVVIDGKSECASEVSVIINPNINANKRLYYARGIKQAKMLCGINYSFIRSTFIEKRRKNLNEKVNNILLTVGGSDFYNATLKILEKIKERSFFNDVEIHIVVGPYFEKNTIFKLKQFSNRNIHIYENVLDLSTLMAEMDLIITTGGTTVFEVMALSIPCIVFAIADNQYDAKGLSKYVNWFGDIRSDNLRYLDDYKCTKMLEYVEKIIYEYKKQQIKIDNIKNEFDGKGIYRITSTIMNKVLK